MKIIATAVLLLAALLSPFYYEGVVVPIMIVTSIWALVAIVANRNFFGGFKKYLWLGFSIIVLLYALRGDYYGAILGLIVFMAVVQSLQVDSFKWILGVFAIGILFAVVTGFVEWGGFVMVESIWREILIGTMLLFLFGLMIFALEWLMGAMKKDFRLLFWGVALWGLVSVFTFIISSVGFVAWSLLTGVVLSFTNALMVKLVEERRVPRPISVKVAGVRIDNETMASAVDRIQKYIEQGGFHLVVTPYSEYVIDAQKDALFMQTLNASDMSLPDGVFVLWATTYNAFSFSNFWPIRLLQCVFRFILVGSSIVLYPGFVRMVIPDRVSGSSLIYPLCEMCARKGYSVFLYGGFDWGNGNSGVLSGNKLKTMYPRLRIEGVYPGDKKKESPEEALEEINKTRPDVLLICVSGGRGEKWAYLNREKLKCKVAIGLGGTFDFVSGYTSRPSRAAISLGLEWFLRPFSKQYGGLTGNMRRAYRVWRGMLKSSIMVLLYKMRSR